MHWPIMISTSLSIWCCLSPIFFNFQRRFSHFKWNICIVLSFQYEYNINHYAFHSVPSCCNQFCLSLSIDINLSRFYIQTWMLFCVVSNLQPNLLYLLVIPSFGVYTSSYSLQHHTYSSLSSYSYWFEFNIKY